MAETPREASSEDEHDFEAFFCKATRLERPYNWQVRIAIDGLPEVLPVPTGLGKTEGAVLAWAWRRFRGLNEPQHLVYCLPMRSLVRQTAERLDRYFNVLWSDHGLPRITVHQLMGGAIDDEWARWPDRPWVLVGTQDQLLSRALNRGYAMSRFEWPVHFGLLNQDCQWIVDEVQLMGPGLWTTSQLDWMRRKRFPFLKPCRTTWMSATVGTGFLATTDRTREGIDSVEAFDARLDDDHHEEMVRRRAARRRVEWFKPSKSKREALHAQIARRALEEHCEGSLTLIICNTVEIAQQTFRALPESPPKILLTSRFRRQDRQEWEQRLLDFETARSAEGRRNPAGKGRIRSDPGLVCVSTQVVEAGLDISAHRLWSELAPWPSVIQRLGRLDRDGSDGEAWAHFWKSPNDQKQKRDGQDWIGPYAANEVKNAETLLSSIVEASRNMPFAKALEALKRTHEKLLEEVLRPAPQALPRARDVHGLFSTERDVHGGFTDVSAFVRGSDADADLTVFWRAWPNAAPPRRDALDGPPFEPSEEGCQVAFFRLREVLKTQHDKAWVWNDDKEIWEECRPGDLRPGMVVMLRQDVGGYDSRLGWSGNKKDSLQNAPRAGRLRALRDDERTETGYWSPLDVHLKDTGAQAMQICDNLGLREDDPKLRPFRTAVVEAAALHDLGKAHPNWQSALPGAGVVAGGPWAKCPRVLAVEAPRPNASINQIVVRLRPGALALPNVTTRDGTLRLRWAVDQKLKRSELDQLAGVSGVRWAGHIPFRPAMRHEAASALAMWQRYRERPSSYPALAVYLAAAHHGKVRTVMRATSPNGDDVFGVGRDPDGVDINGQHWTFDFSVAADGAAGEWREGEFVLTDYGWTGLVADLLGPWRDHQLDGTDVGVVPESEPRRVGPFVLAWLEALVRVADWRASEAPSSSIKPSEVCGG